VPAAADQAHPQRHWLWVSAAGVIFRDLPDGDFGAPQLSSLRREDMNHGAEDGGADAFLLKKTLVTVLLPTIQRLRGSLPPPQASCGSA
jgi:hypothetical protein